jgi:hypothetical protein
LCCDVSPIKVGPLNILSSNIARAIHTTIIDAYHLRGTGWMEEDIVLVWMMIDV